MPRKTVHRTKGVRASQRDEFREWFERTYPVDLSELRAERIRRLVKLMSERQLDLLFLASTGALGERAMVRFAANYATTGRQTCAAITRTGEVFLLVTYSAHLVWAQQTSWADQVWLVNSIAPWVVDFVRQQGASGKVGLVVPEQLFSAITSQAAAKLPGTTFQDIGSDALQLLVAKTQLELHMVAESGRIADAGLQRASESARVGINERALVGAVEEITRREGAESTSILIGSNGTFAGPMAVPRTLQQGDSLQVSVELAGPGGYWVQAVRTYPIGKPSQRLSETIKRLTEIEIEMAACLTDGSEVEAMERHARSLSIDGMLPAVPAWHGIGLGMGEPPTTERGIDWTLRAGMVIVIHPNLVGEGLSVFLGNTYLVGPNGPVALTGQTGM